jgi:hypothetical protein
LAVADFEGAVMDRSLVVVVAILVSSAHAVAAGEYGIYDQTW